MREKTIPLTEFLRGKNLLHITSLNLSGQQLKKWPQEIFLCRNLRKLNLSSNQLDCIPKEISSLTKLRVLNLSSNRLTQIHTSVFGLQKLRVLNISSNKIKSLPHQLQNSSISELILSNNLLTSVDYTLIQGIERLVLSNNRIEQFCPDINLPALYHLWLTGNPCCKNGHICYCVKLPKLKKIYPYINETTAIQLKTQSIMSKNKIFISYSHEDEEWLKIVRVHLKTIENIIGGIDVWDDTRIKTGDKWKEEIDNALKNAGVAILLVSPNFLASDFITNDELPPILKKAESEGTHIFPIFVRQISKTVFLRSKLKDFQFLNAPEKPLRRCSDPDIDAYMGKLLDEIIDKMGL